MKTIQQLREDRKAKAEAVQKLVNEFPEDKQWGDDDQREYDQLVAAVETIDEEIARREKVFGLVGDGVDDPQRRAAAIAVASAASGVSTDHAESLLMAEKAAFKAWASGGDAALSPEQRALMARRVNYVRGALSSTTPAEGGYLTDDTMAANITTAMAAIGGVRNVADVISTATGSEMNFPTSDYTSEEGEILGESQEAADEDTSFGNRVLNTYKYSSKVVAVPVELIQDSVYDIEAHVRNVMARRLQKVTNKHFTLGTNSGQPEGVITAAQVGKVGAAGQTSTITYDDLVDLEHSVDPAYRSNCTWMFHDKSLRQIKKFKDLDGRPIWLPGLVAGEPATLMGYPYSINQDMEEMAANARSVAFGDFKTYKVRDVLQTMYYRFTDSAYATKGQVGFLAMQRHGGRSVDVGGAVKVYQNAAA